MNVLRRYLKLVTCLVVSLGVSMFIANNIMQEETIHIRPNVVGYLANKYSHYTNNILALLKNNKKSINNTADANIQLKQISEKTGIDTTFFKEVSSGVYAKEDEGKTIIDTSQIDHTEYAFKVKDKTIKVRIPKDMPSNQADIQKMLDSGNY